MTARLIQEVAEGANGTSAFAFTNAEGASTALPSAVSGRPGLFFAGLVLSTALSIGGSTAPGLATIEPGRRRYDVAGESATTAEPLDEDLLGEVQHLFDNASSEFFHDGVHSSFSRRLLALLAERGRSAVQAIASYLFSGGASPDVTSEALRWLAEFQDPTTLAQRWSVLERSLGASSPRVRDGAVVGFAVLDDPRALRALNEARDRESTAELQRLIEQVIHQLELSAHAPAAENSTSEPLV